ncbi:MAG: hypothetical protein M1835_003272 [Candelina submexicana]|nr:MAG: hypothetical protein M1835_003272 [Candelina submexicana]
MEVTKRKFELAQNEIKYRVPFRDVENYWPIFAAFGLSCHSFCWTQLERLMPDLSWSSNSEGLLRLWHTLLSQDRDLGGARLFHGPLTQWAVCCQELPNPSVYFAEPALPVKAETKQSHWELLPSTRPFVPPEISHMIATFLDFQDLHALYDAHALPIPKYMLRDRSLQFWEEYTDMNTFQARKAELREMERRREDRVFTRVIRLEDPELCQEDIDEMDEEELEDEAEEIAMEGEDQYAFYPPKAVLNYYRIDKIVRDIARRCDEFDGDANLNLLLPVGLEDPWP